MHGWPVVANERGHQRSCDSLEEHRTALVRDLEHGSADRRRYAAEPYLCSGMAKQVIVNEDNWTLCVCQGAACVLDRARRRIGGSPLTWDGKVGVRARHEASRQHILRHAEEDRTGWCSVNAARRLLEPLLVPTRNRSTVERGTRECSRDGDEVWFGVGRKELRGGPARRPIVATST